MGRVLPVCECCQSPVPIANAPGLPAALRGRAAPHSGLLDPRTIRPKDPSSRPLGLSVAWARPFVLLSLGPFVARPCSEASRPLARPSTIPTKSTTSTNLRRKSHGTPAGVRARCGVLPSVRTFALWPFVRGSSASSASSMSSTGRDPGKGRPASRPRTTGRRDDKTTGSPPPAFRTRGTISRRSVSSSSRRPRETPSPSLTRSSRSLRRDCGGAVLESCFVFGN